MHLSNGEAHRAGRREWAPGCRLAADVPDHASALLARQAVWKAPRLGLSLERARVLASLAFASGRRA